jgi:type IV secretion system protein TrbG
VITTDKRLYTLKIVSTNKKKYIKDVRFWYPEEIQSYWDKSNTEQTADLAKTQQTVIADAPNLSVANLNFNYEIYHAGWHAPSWMPIRAFDDGAHTYIQFPQSISATDMPVMFIKNGDNKELVNYRSKPPYFVVDKIFQQAVLVTNVGSDQLQVTITNRNL